MGAGLALVVVEEGGLKLGEGMFGVGELGFEGLELGTHEGFVVRGGASGEMRIEFGA